MTKRVEDGTVGAEMQTTSTEGTRRGSILQAVSRRFQSLIKNPDRISIPNPDPAKPNASIEVNALIIPVSLLDRLPADICTVRINREPVTGTLVALFRPDSTPATEYRLYRRLAHEEKGGRVIHTPLHIPLRTHGAIYGQQEPPVQRLLITATLQAIQAKKLQEQEEQTASTKPPGPPHLNIFGGSKPPPRR